MKRAGNIRIKPLEKYTSKILLCKKYLKLPHAPSGSEIFDPHKKFKVCDLLKCFSHIVLAKTFVRMAHRSVHLK